MPAPAKKACGEENARGKKRRRDDGATERFKKVTRDAAGS